MHEWTPILVLEIVRYVEELGRSRNLRHSRQSADDTSRLGVRYIHMYMDIRAAESPSRVMMADNDGPSWTDGKRTGLYRACVVCSKIVTW